MTPPMAQLRRQPDAGNVKSNIEFMRSRCRLYNYLHREIVVNRLLKFVLDVQNDMIPH